MKLIVPEKGIYAPFVKRRLLAERHRTIDTAIQFRMGAGFPGDVNRGHPASIQPCAIDAASPPTAYGQAVVVDAASEGIRPVGAGDGALVDIWGVTVRPYPIQQATTANQYGAVPYGGAGVPLQQPVDVLRGGYVMVPVVGAPAKGGAVFIWYAASGGGHTQGGFEAGATGGSTIALSNVWNWNSPADPNGIAELICSRI
jgi:hypothetical protein